MDRGGREGGGAHHLVRHLAYASSEIRMNLETVSSRSRVGLESTSLSEREKAEHEGGGIPQVSKLGMDRGIAYGDHCH